MTKSFLAKLAGALIVFSLLFIIIFRDYRGGKHPFFSDVDQYYSYLPAALIHHDLNFKFPNGYWLVDAPNGNRVPKVSMGMAVLYSPWFIISEGINKTFGIDDKGGYSITHVRVFEVGSAIYLVISCLLLLLVLSRHFSKQVSLITVGLVLFGTNLFYYAYGWPVMAHAYQFLVFSVIMYATVRWYEDQKTKHLLLFAFFLGLAVIVRPVDIFITLFPVLYGISTWTDFKNRILFWKGRIPKLILAKLFFIVPIFIQLLFWKVYAGKWLFFSYGSDEKFFFNNPQVLNFLFSFRKGWLLYTPVMIFALIGFFRLSKSNKNVFLPVFLIFAINLYLLSAWWAWWYGGSFGNRSLIQYYGLLAFPLAAFVALVMEKKPTRIAGMVVGLLLIGLNIFQVWQYEKVFIHWDSMTKEAYSAVFLKGSVPENYENMIWEPDYEGMKRNGFENGLPLMKKMFEGTKDITTAEEFPGGFDLSLNKLAQSEVEKVRVLIDVKSEKLITDGLFLVFTAQEGDSMIVYKSFPVKIDEANKWKHLVFKQNIKDIPTGCSTNFKAYLWNKDKYALQARNFIIRN